MEPDKTLTLRVDSFAGVDIKDAARDLCRLANRVGILCELQFNDVKLWARPGDDEHKLAASYYRQLNSKFTHKIAQAGD
jgi:hypothetical protein